MQVQSVNCNERRYCKFRHYNDYYHDYYGPRGNLLAFPDHPAAALSATRSGPVATVGVHPVNVVPAAAAAAAAATVDHIQSVEIHTQSAHPIPTFGRIQRKNENVATKSAMKSEGDDMYEYPDEQVEEINVY